MNKPFCLLNIAKINPNINKNFFLLKNDKIINSIDIKNIKSINSVGIAIKYLNWFGLNKTRLYDMSFMLSVTLHNINFLFKF